MCSTKLADFNGISCFTHHYVYFQFSSFIIFFFINYFWVVSLPNMFLLSFFFTLNLEKCSINEF